MAGSQPGIEIRIVTPRGEILSGDSLQLHFELAGYWIYSGWDPATWYPVGGGWMHGPILVQIRVVDVAALATGAELELELAELGARAAGAGQLAEVGADVDQAPAAGHAAAPVPEVDTGAAILTELPVKDARARPPGRRRSADLGSAIARIARRARFLSGR